MQIADELSQLESYENKWSRELYDEFDNKIKNLDQRDKFLAPFIKEINKYFTIQKVEINEKNNIRKL